MKIRIVVDVSSMFSKLLPKSEVEYRVSAIWSINRRFKRIEWIMMNPQDSEFYNKLKEPLNVVGEFSSNQVQVTLASYVKKHWKKGDRLVILSTEDYSYPYFNYHRVENVDPRNIVKILNLIEKDEK